MQKSEKTTSENSEDYISCITAFQKKEKISYYEAYAVKENVDKGKFYMFLEYRNIDSILYKEKAIQERLQGTG